MQNNRRCFDREKIKGVALVYCKKLETTYLLDIGVGGMRVSSKSSFPVAEPLWVEFTLIQSNEMIFGKRTQAELVYSEYNTHNRRFTLGFQFLNLTDFQCNIINVALAQHQSV